MSGINKHSGAPEVAPPPSGGTETCKPGQMERVSVTENKFQALAQISAQLGVDGSRVVSRAQAMNIPIHSGDTLMSYGSEVIVVLGADGQEKGAILTKKPDHASMTDPAHVQKVLERSKAHVNTCKATIGETWNQPKAPVTLEKSQFANGEVVTWNAPVAKAERMVQDSPALILPGESQGPNGLALRDGKNLAPGSDVYNVRTQVLTDVAHHFGLDPRVTVDLIYQESNHDPAPKDNKVCLGLMQVGLEPTKDMKVLAAGGRGANYFDSFSNIPQSAIDTAQPTHLGKAMEQLRTLAQKGDEMTREEKRTYDTQIGILMKNRQNPYVNVVLGCAYLARMKTEATRDIGESANSRDAQNLASKVDRLSLNVVNKMREAAGKTPMTEAGLRGLADSIRQSPAHATQFQALVDYNGSATNLGNGIARKYYYAAAILVNDGRTE